MGSYSLQASLEAVPDLYLLWRVLDAVQSLHSMGVANVSHVGAPQRLEEVHGTVYPCHRYIPAIGWSGLCGKNIERSGLVII